MARYIDIILVPIITNQYIMDIIILIIMIYYIIVYSSLYIEGNLGLNFNHFNFH